jgi:hypothetical protein
MERVAGAPAFRLSASARGVGVIAFRTKEARDQAVAMSPITYCNNAITIEPHEAADNRFFAFYSLYAEIAVEDYPLEHWEEERIREALGGIGNVCCIDPDCLEGGDFTSVRAVLRLDSINEIPDKLLVRNHSGPACIARVHLLRSWHSEDPWLAPVTCRSTRCPSMVPPVYHPFDEPPAPLLASAAGWVPTEVLVDNDEPTPDLLPVGGKRATPYPVRAGAASSPAPPTPTILALPWYDIGGVPPASGAREERGGDQSKDNEHEGLKLEEDPKLGETKEELPEDVAVALAALSVEQTEVFSAGATTEAEHESRTQKRHARRKRAKDSVRKLRRSLRLQEKEEPLFEKPEAKAARI